MNPETSTRDRSAPFLELRDLEVRFGTCRALDGVSLAVRPGEFVGVLGPSGCGKTTLLRVIAGLQTRAAGTVHLRGRDITRLPPAARGCGIVFQSYALFPNLTVAKNVAYGLSRRGTTRAQLRRRVDEMLRLVGLEGCDRKYPAQLSGGQQQRVALARALAPNPSLLLLDEPLSALDTRVRVRLRAEIRALQQRLGVTTLLVTHDQEEALTMTDRIMVMRDGRAVQDAPPTRLYREPADLFVADFIGTMNFLGEWTARDAHVIARNGRDLHVAAPLDFPAHTRLHAAVRPEDVRIGGTTHNGANLLDGTVRFVEFRGQVYRVRVQVALEAGAEPLSLEADVQFHELERLGLAEGARVRLQVPPDRILVFPVDPPVPPGHTMLNEGPA